MDGNHPVILLGIVEQIEVVVDLRIGIVDPDFADPGFDDQVKAMIAACPSAIAKT